MGVSATRSRPEAGVAADRPSAPRAIGAAPLRAALDAFDEAIAIVERVRSGADGRGTHLGDAPCVFVSAAFRRHLPAARAGATLGEAVAAEPALARGLAELSPTASARELVAFGDAARLELRVEPLPAGRIAVRLRVEANEDELHRYVSARESLFSASRTISVSEMASTLAHEINQPVGTIANLLRGVRARLDRPEPALGGVVEALDRALEQTRFTANVIARIRDFTSRRRPRRDALDLRALLDESVALLDWLLASTGTRLELVDVEPGLGVLGDETMLRQVIINLVRNAVDAGRGLDAERRRIDVSARRDGEFVRIDVRDRGRGLDSPDTLFAPFVTDKPDGTGIGLNICRSFVELHQGKLWLTPHEREGCVAHLALPTASVPPVGATR